MIIKMFTELGKRMDEHSEHYNKEMENVIKYQIEVKELKITITELKNTLNAFNSQLDGAKKEIHRAVELTQSEQQKEKRMKRNEDTLMYLGDNIKQTNIHIIGVPEGGERERGRKLI